MKFLNFFQFLCVGNFCSPGSTSWFRIRIRVHWPDWIWIRIRNTVSDHFIYKKTRNVPYLIEHVCSGWIMLIFAGQRKDSCVSRVRQEVCDRQHAQQSHQASPQVGLRAVQSGSIRWFSFIKEMGCTGLTIGISRQALSDMNFRVGGWGGGGGGYSRVIKSLAKNL